MGRLVRVLAVSLVTLGALVVGGLSAPASQAAPVTSDPIVSAPSIEPPAPTESTPVTFDQDSATVSSQDEYSTTYVDKNGVYQMQLSATPVNVKVNGKWMSASATLVEDGKSGLKDARHPLSPHLAATASDSSLLQVSRDGYSMSFALTGAGHAAVWHPVVPVPNVPSNQAIYRSVLPNTDLEYEVAADLVKESLVLRKAPAASKAVYTWTVDAPGLTPEKNAFGDLGFVDVEGTVVFTMPNPVMWDSSGKVGEREPAMANVPYEVTKTSESTYELTMRPDMAWLRDAKRVYPVYLDPSVAPGPNDIHAYKSDGVHYTGTVRVGNPYQSRITHWRTVLHYNYEQVFGNQVTGAYLSATKTSGTANCYGGGIYYATAFSFNGIGGGLSYFPVCASGGGTITGQIAYWVNTGQSGWYLMLTGYEDWGTNRWSYKVLATSLTITYVARPTITDITAATPQNGQIGVAMPIMQAIGSESTGTGQNFQYAFTSSDGGTAWTSPWTPSGPYQVPAGVLTPGSHYTYTISTNDNYPDSPIVTSTNPTRYSFVTDFAPNEPTNVAVGTQTRPTLSATVSDTDSGEVQALFTIKQGDLVIVDSLAGSKVTGTPPLSGGVSSVDLPYELAPNTIYTVEVRAFDGSMVSTTTSKSFTTGPPSSMREIPHTWDNQTGVA